MLWKQLLLGGLLCVMTHTVTAGMPAPLPTTIVSDGGDQFASTGSGFNPEHLQAISFFVVLLLVSAAGVRCLWNSLSRDYPPLPRLNYRRSLSLVLLWGALFVVVLAMISGARELMTPGAWRKTGWTYQLQMSGAQSESAAEFMARRQAFEDLRMALWNFALSNDGILPASQNEPLIPADCWRLPHRPLLNYVYRPTAILGDSSSLIAVEPDIGEAFRLVLWGDGRITPESSKTILSNWEPVAGTEGDLP